MYPRLFRKLARKLNYLPKEHIAAIYQAYQSADKAHTGQKRHSGEPYITHPVAVAVILSDLHVDYQSIMAALLHDVLEDTAITKTQMIQQFGAEITQLVDGLSKLTQIQFKTRMEAQAENFRKMVLAMAHDLRIILIKLADRLHNIRTLDAAPPEKRQRIARETLEIYAPIAQRLGMHVFSVEMEDICFQTLYPQRYRVLKNEVRKLRGHRKEILDLVHAVLKKGLAQSHITASEIQAREKHLYSIYKKMRDRKISFKEIMDIYAFRIITDNVDSCYRILGIVHSLYKPLTERFNDYIAIPKANGYQSLHTTVFGPYGVPVEVQMRTREMDDMANNGIAAHWLYKTKNESIDYSELRAHQWVKNLIEMQKSTGSSLEFIENVKVDLFPDEVYVFTPRGSIMRLPAGATPVDFAYSVHTDIGNSCVATKIDRQLSPLSTPLSNGQTIEIITASDGRPSPSWLNFVVTSKARSGIRQYLKNQKKAESIVWGKQLLNKALKNLSISLNKIPPASIEALLRETGLKTFEDLLADIGLGNRIATLDAYNLAHAGQLISIFNTETAAADPVIVKGTEGMILEYASCCHPIPGDPIIGILKAGQGMIVHLEQCKRIVKLLRQPEKYLPLNWSKDISQDFLVPIRVHFANQRGALADMARAIAEVNVDIEDVHVNAQDKDYITETFNVWVRDRMHLSRVIENLSRLKFIKQVARG